MKIKRAKYIQLTLHIDRDSTLFNKLVTLQRSVFTGTASNFKKRGSCYCHPVFCQGYEAYEQITENDHVAWAIYTNGKCYGLALLLHGMHLGAKQWRFEPNVDLFSFHEDYEDIPSITKYWVNIPHKRSVIEIFSKRIKFPAVQGTKWHCNITK